MDVYGQEPEVRLLSAILPLLATRTAIDVGAERGALVEALLAGGATEVYAFEPEPQNVAALRKRFDANRRVTVHGVGVSDVDGELKLRLSKDPDGTPLSFGHTILERPATDEIAWHESVRVQARSLGSLVENGEIPRRVGILKVDTEGHDLAVVTGMGALECDVIVVEHWRDLPRSLGPCPWSIDEMTAAVSRHGFSHFAFLHHSREVTILQWDDAALPAGSMGNLLFIHDRVLDLLLPSVLECASALAVQALDLAETRSGVAAERLAVIEGLKREVDIQTEAAAARLAAIEELEPGVANDPGPALPA